jgi:hypothetical protein
VGGTRGDLSSGAEYIAKTRQGAAKNVSIHKPIRSITKRRPQFPVLLIPESNASPFNYLGIFSVLAKAEGEPRDLRENG